MGALGAVMSASIIAAGVGALLYYFKRLPARAMLGFALVALVLIGIFMRSGLLQYQGLFEPDGFYYYSIINQTIHNNFTVPGTSALSGFPWHNPRGEEPGLPYLTVLFYIVLRPIGAAALQIMRTLPVLFGAIYMLMAYVLSRFFVKSRTLGLLAALFVGISSGNIARTAATVYRGDTFVPFFLLLALIFLLRAFKNGTGAKGKIIAISLASITLSLAIMVWGGSPYVIAVYMLALFLVTLYGFVAMDRDVMKTNLMAVIGFLGTFVLETVFIAINAARSPVIFLGYQFFILYLPLLLGSAAAYWYIVKKRRRQHPTLATWPVRLLVALAIIALIGGIVIIVFGGTLSGIVSSLGSSTNASVSKAVVQAINATTQESQAPDLGFLLDSFSLQIFLAPVGMILFVLFMNRFHRKSHDDDVHTTLMGMNGVTMGASMLLAALIAYPFIASALAGGGNSTVTIASLVGGLVGGTLCYMGLSRLCRSRLSKTIIFSAIGAVATVVALLALLLTTYTLLQAVALIVTVLLLDVFVIYGAVRDGMHITASVPFLAMIGYFMVSAYMQSTAIRYNALFSLPIAVFAAYAVYMAARLLYQKKISVLWMCILAAVLIDAIAVLLGIFQFGVLFSTSNGTILGSAVVIDAVLAYLCVYNIIGAARKSINLGIVFACLITVFIIMEFYNTYIGVFTAQQADGINPQFLAAMSWLNTNTYKNATVWGIWPDGSVIEGFGNRQSYMDSVGGENGTRIYHASQFLFNTTIDSQYLINIGKPQYIVARTFWMEELGGLAQEGLVQNESLYGYDLMAQATQTHNSTTTEYSFQSNDYDADLFIVHAQNGTNRFTAFLNLPGTDKYAQIKSVLFYDDDNDSFSTISTNATSAVNYTLLVTYGKSGLQGGAILGQDLVNSNLFKLVYLCSPYQCEYGDKNVSLQPVFLNNDTRIYRVYYNTTGAAS